MQIGVSLRRNAAAAVAAAALCWLVIAVNTLGDDTQRGAALLLRQPPSVPLTLPTQAREAGGGGLDLIDMYQCMCASSDDIGLWVKWWFIAATFGGVPIAVLLRSRDYNPRHEPGLTARIHLN